MSQTIILTEDQYAILAQAGKARNQTPQDVLAAWIETVRRDNRVSSTADNTPGNTRSYRLRHVAGDPNVTQPSMYHSQGSSK